MKKFLVLFFSIFICSIAHADTETINWYVDGNSYATTTCQTGGDIILPNTPYKYGYTFQGWFGYTPIEYIETTGTQWIDTGEKTTGLDRYVSSWTSTSTTDNYALYGGSNGSIASGERGLYWYGNNFDIIVPNSSSSGYVLTVNNIWYNNTNYTIDDNLNYFKANDLNTPRTISSSFVSAYNLFLFKMNRGPNTGRGDMVRLKSFKWYRNDILFRDFIPVLDHNNTPCLYDKVTNQFFYNQGTGDFIAGPVINQ